MRTLSGTRRRFRSVVKSFSVLVELVEGVDVRLLRLFLAPIVDGSGGGKPDLAQAGGKSPEKIGLAMEKAKDYMRAKSTN